MDDPTRRADVLLVADATSIHARRLAAALAELGLTVDLASFQGAPIRGVRLHRLGDLPPSADLRYLLSIVPLARLLRLTRPRLVHAHFVSSYGLMTALAHRLAFPLGGGMPVVQSPWGNDLLVTARRSRLRAALAAFTLRSAALVTGNSRSLREQSVRLAPRTPWHRFVWGPHRSVVGAPHRPERIALSTRRLEPNMRVELVVAAFRRARSQAPEALHGWELLVTHDGSSSGAVRAAAENDPAIRFVGVLEYAELHRLLLRSAMIISVPESDATSAALMDGLAAGLIPVVNALPGNLEWVDTEIGEVVARDPSVDEVAAAIVRAARRSTDAARIRDRVRDIVWEDEVPRLIDAYRRLRGSLGAGG